MAGAQAWTHDDRGNATAIGSTTYAYDAENRLTGMNSSAVTMAYDPAGRLYEHAGAATERYVYDGVDLIAEYDTSGNVLRRYVHGPGADEPMIWYEGSGTTGSDRRFLVADERGSITVVTDNAGAVLATNTYDEYGLPTTTSPTYAGRFRFTGQTWFPDLELYNYKARFYDPEAGRFLQTDPIGYGDGMNLYAYVGNDPINFSDPTGTETVCTTRITWDERHEYTGGAITGVEAYNRTRDTTCNWEWEDSPNILGDSDYSATVSIMLGGAAGVRGRGGSSGSVPHLYSNKTKTSCSVNEAMNQIMTNGWSAPGAGSAVDNASTAHDLDPLIGFLPDSWFGDYTERNPIVQRVSSRSGVIENITAKGHIFHSGTVMTTVKATPYGSVIESRGAGRNSSAGRAALNTALGWVWFAGRNNLIAYGCSVGGAYAH